MGDDTEVRTIGFHAAREEPRDANAGITSNANRREHARRERLALVRSRDRDTSSASAADLAAELYELKRTGRQRYSEHTVMPAMIEAMQPYCNRVIRSLSTRAA